MKIALDTNRHVDLCKGVPETVTMLEEADSVTLPVVVLGERRAGFALGRRHARNERTLRRFLSTTDMALSVGTRIGAYEVA